MTSQLIEGWLALATPDALREKLSEYENRLEDMNRGANQRDAETLARLSSRIKLELAQWETTS